MFVPFDVFDITKRLAIQRKGVQWTKRKNEKKNRENRGKKYSRG